MAVIVENARLEITNIDWDGDGDSEIISYHFEDDVLLKEIEQRSQTPTTTTEASEPTQNAILSFQGQSKTKNFQFRMYDDGKYKDKTKGTMAEAGLADADFAPGPIIAVDTTNDEVTVPGEHPRVSTGDTVAIDTKGNAPANDGVYTVQSISYESGNDETTYGLDGDLTDSTAIGAISHSIVTVFEQMKFFGKYIDNPNIRSQGRLYGLNWSDPDGDGFKEGTPVRINQFRKRKQSEDPLRATGFLNMDVGFSV